MFKSDTNNCCVYGHVCNFRRDHVCVYVSYVCGCVQFRRQDVGWEEAF